ncbi:4937_t:CDS:1, partial [Rhizophagus irregularis]
TYFRNKVLKLYPSISLRRSNKFTDIYHCKTKSSLCPSCRTNHKENIVDYYKKGSGTSSSTSYSIGCMFRYTGDLEVVA